MGTACAKGQSWEEGRVEGQNEVWCHRESDQECVEGDPEGRPDHAGPHRPQQEVWIWFEREGKLPAGGRLQFGWSVCQASKCRN